MAAERRLPSFTPSRAQRGDGAPSLTIEYSTTLWQDPFMRVSLKYIEDKLPFQQSGFDSRMDLTTEAEALFENDSRHKDKSLQPDLTINKYGGLFSATYSLLPLAIHVLIKQLANCRVHYSSEFHSNELWRLAECTKVARLRW